MTTPRHRHVGTWIAVAGLSLASLHGQPSIQQQIDALLKSRLRPQSLPVDPPNPFRDVKAIQRESGGDWLATKPAVPADSDLLGTLALADLDPARTTNAAALASCVSRLKIGGLMRVKDNVHIVINDVPRREGDSIFATWRDTSVAIRVVKIQAGELTLRLGDAETVVKF
jgi:hypothetical protein